MSRAISRIPRSHLISTPLLLQNRLSFSIRNKLCAAEFRSIHCPKLTSDVIRTRITAHSSDLDVMSEKTPPLQPTLSIDPVAGNPTDILSVESSSPKFKIIIIPGNPGLVDFYYDYTWQLYTRLNGVASVYAVCHLGHTRQDYSRALYSLEDQIRHKVDYVKKVLNESPDRPLVIIGHSIGAHIAMEVYRRLGSPSIHQIIGLYPFLSLNEQSKWQKVLNFAAHRSTLGIGLSALGGLLGRLPSSVVGSFVRRSIASGWSPAATEVFCKYMLQYHVIRNYGYMGMTEFDTFRSDVEWELVREIATKLTLIFGEDDHWGPLTLKEEMEKRAPEVKLIVERQGHEHAFCCSSEGSNWVADQCVSLLNSSILSSIS